MPVRISIALATYNGARYLPEQLQSYLDQERLPDELVVSDDGSGDETCNLVDSFAKTAPFDVRIVRQDEQLGYVANFDCALSMATGDLVFLSDQDDLWLPGKISEVSAIMERNPELLLVLNDAEITSSELSSTQLTKLGQLRSSGSPDSAFVMGCCCAIRRELLEFCLPIPGDARGHDNWLVDFSNGLGATRILEKVLQLYRRHESNESLVIANSTHRVNRLDRIKKQLGIAFSSDSATHASREIDYFEQLHGACRRALGTCNGEYDARINRYSVQLDKQLKMLRIRHALRSRPLYIRLFKAPALWLLGSYREANGVKSMIRDLIG